MPHPGVLLHRRGLVGEHGVAGALQALAVHARVPVGGLVRGRVDGVPLPGVGPELGGGAAGEAVAGLALVAAGALGELLEGVKDGVVQRFLLF